MPNSTTRARRAPGVTRQRCSDLLLVSSGGLALSQ